MRKKPHIPSSSAKQDLCMSSKKGAFRGGFSEQSLSHVRKIIFLFPDKPVVDTHHAHKHFCFLLCSLQKARMSALESINKPKSRSIVVATDVAARGLDISSVSTVVHYDVPRAVDTFIHRAGRTAVSFHFYLIMLECLCFDDSNDYTGLRTRVAYYQD